MHLAWKLLKAKLVLYVTFICHPISVTVTGVYIIVYLSAYRQ